MNKPDWATIEVGYCAGISVRQLARDYGVSDTAIHKRANKEGWEKASKPKKVCTANQTANLQTESQTQTEHSVLYESTPKRFTLADYGLNPQQRMFVDEYLKCMNKVEAYKRAGYQWKGDTGAAAARRLYRHVSVNKAIHDGLAAREERTQITQDAVLKMWWDIANADPNDLVQFRRLCCRHCWGKGHAYQWVDENEYELAVDKAIADCKQSPMDNGGYGFNPTDDPNPDCPECTGEGTADVHIKDSRDLTGPARRLYAGVKETKFGIEVITRSQDKALENVAKFLGMDQPKREAPDEDTLPDAEYTVLRIDEDAPENPIL